MKILLCLCLALGFALQPLGAAAAPDPLNEVVYLQGMGFVYVHP